MVLMAGIVGNQPDPPACPLLGLAADRRTHFTYPHPGHRCFAKGHPTTADARRQAAYCLSLDFATCDRYRAWLSIPESKRQPGPSQPDRVAPGDANTPGTQDESLPPTVIYVFRNGDSLNQIAARFDLTVGEILTANAGIQGHAPTDGTRLVIPLRAGAPTVRRPR
jgi:LysM repeat protein